MNNRNYFSLLVIGDDPDAQIEAFGPGNAPSTVLKRSDLAQIRVQTLGKYERILAGEYGDELNRKIRTMVQSRYDKLKALSDDEFWDEITFGFDMSEDGETATLVEPGKYEVITRAKYFAMPFIDRDGKEVYQALMRDINWRATDGEGAEKYISAWETVIDGRKPKDKNEAQIFNVMKGHKQYILGFGTKDNYVESSTKFWTYSVLKDGVWTDLDDSSDEHQFDWVHKYYRRFISGLDGDTLLTLYEYKTNPF